MQDAQIKHMLSESPSVDWFVTVILDQARMAHVANHHETYSNGNAEFGHCMVKACVLAPFTCDQADKLYGTTQAAACPSCGPHEHIQPMIAAQGDADKQVFHCDDCHMNFVFKPEQCPFGAEVGGLKSDFCHFVEVQSERRCQSVQALLRI